MKDWAKIFAEVARRKKASREKEARKEESRRQQLAKAQERYRTRHQPPANE